MKTVKRSSIATDQRMLLDLLHWVDYGYIEDLAVVDGEAVLDPPPKVVRVIKLRDACRFDPQRDDTDFVLKTQMVQLLACISEIGHGTVRRIEVQGGLPFKIEIEGIGIASCPPWEE